MFDVLLGISFETDQLQQTDLRDHEALSGAGDDQTRNDGQRERNLQLHGGALARPAKDIDDAADLFDIGFHNVHPHAAAGNVGNGLGG